MEKKAMLSFVKESQFYQELSDDDAQRVDIDIIKNDDSETYDGNIRFNYSFEKFETVKFKLKVSSVDEKTIRLDYRYIQLGNELFEEKKEHDLLLYRKHNGYSLLCVATNGKLRHIYQVSSVYQFSRGVPIDCPLIYNSKTSHYAKKLVY